MMNHGTKNDWFSHARVRLVDDGSSLYVNMAQLKWLPEQFYFFPLKVTGEEDENACLLGCWMRVYWSSKIHLFRYCSIDIQTISFQSTITCDCCKWNHFDCFFLVVPIFVMSYVISETPASLCLLNTPMPCLSFVRQWLVHFEQQQHKSDLFYFHHNIITITTTTRRKTRSEHEILFDLLTKIVDRCSIPVHIRHVHNHLTDLQDRSKKIRKYHHSSFRIIFREQISPS